MSLVIRREQVDEIMAVGLDEFYNNVVGHLRRVWPSETARMTPQEVGAWVRHGVDVGRGFGVTSEYDVARLVDLMLLLGPGLHADVKLPWCAEVLGNHQLSGRQKVDRLMSAAATYFSVHAGGARDTSKVRSWSF